MATDYQNNHRYQHRARVVIVGTASLKLYDPIYLDGLPNGLSGYWTILSIKHTLGGEPANFMTTLEVGTDVIGDVNPNAAASSGLRDIQGELANQTLSGSTSQLVNQSPTINASTLAPSYGTVSPTPQVNQNAAGIPNLTNTPFPNAAPNLTLTKNPVQWIAQNKGSQVAI